MAEVQEKYQLRLYITDKTDKSERLIDKLKTILDEELEEDISVTR